MRKLILFAVLFLLVSQAYGAVTVGQFIDRIATTSDVSSLKFDRNKVLTEGVMVKISVAIGINVTTATPDKIVTDKQVETYFSVFDNFLQGSQAQFDLPPGSKPPHPLHPPHPPPPPGKHKGPHSPSDPNGDD
jgi:hypothetical protein